MSGLGFDLLREMGRNYYIICLTTREVYKKVKALKYQSFLDLGDCAPKKPTGCNSYFLSVLLSVLNMYHFIY